MRNTPMLNPRDLGKTAVDNWAGNYIFGLYVTGVGVLAKDEKEYLIAARLLDRERGVLSEKPICRPQRITLCSLRPSHIRALKEKQAGILDHGFHQWLTEECLAYFQIFKKLPPGFRRRKIGGGDALKGNVLPWVTNPYWMGFDTLHHKFLPIFLKSDRYKQMFPLVPPPPMFKPVAKPCKISEVPIAAFGSWDPKRIVSYQSDVCHYDDDMALSRVPRFYFIPGEGVPEIGATLREERLEKDKPVPEVSVEDARTRADNRKAELRSLFL